MDGEFLSLISNFYGLEAVGIKSVVVFSGDRGSLIKELITLISVAWCFHVASRLVDTIREITVKFCIIVTIVTVACCNFLRTKRSWSSLCPLSVFSNPV